MKLTFLGATQTVTGSKYLIEESGKKYLVDCGLFQGLKELRLRNWAPFPLNPSEIQAVVLTHAHLDHTGYLPLLVKNGFKGPIYASQATRDLCNILLRDSGRLQEEDARQANRYGYSQHKPAKPLYTEDDADECLKHFKTVQFDKPYALDGGLTFSLAHSGHILGSAFITLKNQTTTLVFSGDLGRPHDPVMLPPVTIKFADYLVLESTYGNRLHPKVDTLDQLAAIVNSTISKGGSVVIPSFAVGRAQTLLYYIYMLKQQKRIPQDLPVYLDSPMAQDATDLFCKYENEHSLSKEACPLVCSVAKYLKTPEESKQLNNSTRPSIIISASGMAEGGRVLYHIAHYGPESENTILFAGFQAAGTRGAEMLKGAKEVRIHGHMVPINARIENLEALSSHADYEELLQWLKGFEIPPKEVFLTHGEDQAAESLKSKIEKAYGWKTVVPKYLQSFDL
jgi:metallo-beta-lactamase family protein